MVNYPPEYCPYCGNPIEAFEEPKVYACESCNRWIFHNPTPTARVLVLDGESFLLVKQTEDTGGMWTIPGGHLEIGNNPEVHAAEELEEETGLLVNPEDLILFDADTFKIPENHYRMSMYYAVKYEDTTGEIEAGSDASEARFWTPSEFDEADHGYPDIVKRITKHRKKARKVLDREHS